ncbi:hypothetical protein N7501_009327 [Penicillium viridicatum]|nr:hypothetical protein N7501_009327 [Penicillium viridicatum]
MAGTVHCIKYISKQMYRYHTPKQDGSKPDPKQNEWQCKQDEKKAFEQNAWAGCLRLRRDERSMAGER